MPHINLINLFLYLPELNVNIFGKSKERNPNTPTSQKEVAALPPAPATAISDGTKIVGEVTSSDQVQIDGELEGNLFVKNHVIVGKTGKVSANLEVKSLQVFGQVVGDVVSQERVSIERSGTIEGNITAPNLAISEGALFRGNIDMSQRINNDKGKKNQDKVPTQDAKGKLDLKGAVQ